MSTTFHCPLCDATGFPGVVELFLHVGAEHMKSIDDDSASIMRTALTESVRQRWKGYPLRILCWCGQPATIKRTGPNLTGDCYYMNGGGRSSDGLFGHVLQSPTIVRDPELVAAAIRRHLVESAVAERA